MSLVAAIVAVLLVLLARLLIGGIRGASSVVYRWVPRRIAAFLGAAIFAVLLVTVVNGTLVSATIGAIDRAQALVDVTNPPGASVPRCPRDRVVPALRSRGRISAEPASNSSRRGRGRRILRHFTGRPALEPIRVYAGLRSADSPEDQAQLALADVIRMGAFSRSILVIATPTGTGWVDNNGIAPLEYMHDGDVATVAVQFFYLQSRLSLIHSARAVQRKSALQVRVSERQRSRRPSQ